MKFGTGAGARAGAEAEARCGDEDGGGVVAGAGEVRLLDATSSPPWPWR
jgi:hypothetical protein